MHLKQFGLYNLCFASTTRTKMAALYLSDQAQFDFRVFISFPAILPLKMVNMFSMQLEGSPFSVNLENLMGFLEADTQMNETSQVVPMLAPLASMLLASFGIERALGAYHVQKEQLAR